MVYPEAPFILPEIGQLVAAAERGIAACKRRATEWGAPRVDTRVAQGVPCDRIVHMAKDDGFDLIVIGTHGRTGLTHALLGSVAEKVVRHAPGAVLVVR
jgi:nucleotide-binding universal stress UspA family protein